MDKKELIEVARGDREPDLVLRGKILSVFTGDIIEGDVAIYGNKVAGIGEYSCKNILKVDGYILPGFMDAHMHLESTLMTPKEFAKAIIPQGTTSVFIDPHEIANVVGVEGIKYIYEASRELPVDFYITVPSCVPAIKGFETYGAEITAKDVASVLNSEGVIGLAEVMNFPGVIYGDDEVLEKIKVAHTKVVDGHAPGLSGNQLNAYLAAGVLSDHECITVDEVLEKVNRGMKVMLREGSVAKNLLGLIEAVKYKKESNENFMLASDDLLPIDIQQGHINYRIRLCVENGISPGVAVKMATLNTARYFGLTSPDNKKGAIAPGYVADIVVVDDLSSFNVQTVIKNGKIIWGADHAGDMQVGSNSSREVFSKSHSKSKSQSSLYNSVKLPDFNLSDIEVGARATDDKLRVIELVKDQIITKNVVTELPIKNGKVHADVENDVAKIIVVDRHNKGKYIGIGFVKGFGIKKGAVASSVSHDSHNVICVGIEDSDILHAVNRVGELHGGFVVVSGGEVKSELPLPIAGLMSDRSFEDVRKGLENVYSSAKSLGISLEHPLTTLSFLALPVIPELKITDMGLVDVNQMKFVDLWV